jgi:hypothetical protein
MTADDSVELQCRPCLGDIEKIIRSQWTPWPGYSVDPTRWS